MSLMGSEMSQAVFDIMTGLERLVHIPPGSHHASRRYLTPFYSFTLGLAIILALSACGSGVDKPLASATPDQPGSATLPTSLTHSGTQAIT